MSEVVSEVPTPARTAGGLLREARQAHGIHIAALAATIKVSQRKLESLEADRFDELPDATFTRALAQTVCRALKMDPAPVLALLPAPLSHRLEHVSQGINQPFRERAARAESSERTSRVSPGMWAALALIVLAAGVYLLPQSWISGLGVASSGVPAAPEAPSSGVSTVVLPSPVEPAAGVAPEPLASGEGVAAPPTADVGMPAALPASAPSSAVMEAADSASTSMALGGSAPAPALPASAASVAAGNSVPAPVLQLRALAPSWVEVRDARSEVVLARLVNAGEEVTLDAPAPLRVKIGNARGTQLTFRGQVVDLAAAGGRDNVARLELK
jgi:cytoskeleton protein RodZ